MNINDIIKWKESSTVKFNIVAFLVVLFFVVGLVIGFSFKKETKIVEKAPGISVNTTVVRDTVIKMKTDTIVIPVNKIKYFTKTDTVFVDKKPVVSDSVFCVKFPLVMEDSSKIEITECSKDQIPLDLDFNAKFIDKRETIRIIESTKIDTLVQNKTKRLGFTIGPSAGVGIDINNLSKPAYFVGITLTYGLRF